MKSLKSVIVVLSTVVVLQGCDKSVEESKKQIIVEQYNLPPAPDAELIKTEFIDSNDNKVRDDVERQIVFTHHENPERIDVFMDMASSWKSSVDNIDDMNVLMNNANKAGIHTSCLVRSYGEDFTAIEAAIREIEDQIENTFERRKQAAMYRSKLSGQSFSLPSEEELDKVCP